MPGSSPGSSAATVVPCLPQEGKTFSPQGIPTAEEFDAKATRVRAIIVKLAAKGKCFYFRLRDDRTSFEKQRCSIDAGSVLVLAEDLFKNLGDKVLGFMLLERIARPLELLDKRNLI